jgi:drug/metabolite transporter (DMT)-like permease
VSRPIRFDRPRSGYAIGLIAALLFGASAPVSKVLLDDVGPQMLAGLLYLGAFLAVAPFVRFGARRSEARLRRSDVPLLSGIIVAGGIAAPVLLMLGLERLTLVVGVVVLHEYLGRRAGLGTLVTFLGSAFIGLQGGSGDLNLLGAVLIVAACLGWAVDNNLTQRLSVRDPFQIVAVKTGVAATVNIVLAIVRGEALPSLAVLAAALALGVFAYGVSILLDAYALRALGAAREAAVFATAPFAGALLAVPLLAETWTVSDVAAAVAMAVGVAMLIGDRHEHEHIHSSLSHDHRHLHDEHHQHEHPPGIDPSAPHSHPHQHEPLVHAHLHVSDVHHRHRHH